MVVGFKLSSPSCEGDSLVILSLMETANGKAEQHFCVVAVVKLINPAQDGRGTLRGCPLKKVSQPFYRILFREV